MTPSFPTRRSSDLPDRILPEAIDLATPPNLPGWSIGTLDERRARARTVVAAWESAHDAPLRLRIALPDGPGATLLFGGITALLAATGESGRASCGRRAV